MNQNIEQRNFCGEIRLANDSRKISGYAAVFNSASRDMGFTEYIDTGAFDGVLERSDVFALLNHDSDKILARSNKGVGSLTLTIDERGLKYEFDAPHTDLGNTVLEFVKRNELTESSFAFVVEKDTWEKMADGTYVRHINKISSLHDVSPCWTAAYAATSVSCRSFEEFKEQERLEAEKRAAEEEAEKQAKEEAEKKAQEEAAERERMENIKKVHQELLDEYKDYIKK